MKKHPLLSTNATLAAVLVLFCAEIGRSQTAQVYPPELSRIPESSLAGGRYFQQLRIEFAADDGASDETVSIAMPGAVFVADTDADGLISDEIRVKYEAVGGEQPRFFVSNQSTRELILIGSSDIAAAGGRLYVQFPIETEISDQGSAAAIYGGISFADGMEADIQVGPELSVVSAAAFSTLGSMNLVSLASLLSSQTDTTTSAAGTFYPDDATVLVESLPDLVFDSDDPTTSNLLPFSDGDDGNDTPYRFFLAPVGTLDSIDVSIAVVAVLEDNSVYTENEGAGRSIRLLASHLSVGIYYLYVTADVTGSIPLARSRGLVVRHGPQVQSVDPASGSITLDSGGLYDLEGNKTGNGFGSVDLAFAAFDHDDEVTVHLLYSPADDLAADSLQLGADSEVELPGATRLTPASGVSALAESFRWDIVSPELAAAGDYYIYAVGVGGAETTLRRSDNQIHVRHSPFLRLDALDDAVTSGADTVKTGGLRPQQFVTVTWGRSGSDGDGDPDSDAAIALYYSTRPAVNGAESTADGFAVPGGAAEFLLDADTRLIVDELREDGDGRQDNQYVWDLYEADSVPAAGIPVYLYGIITDDTDARLVQLNGGRLNDSASRHYFIHEPSLRALQPFADIAIQSGVGGRISWQDEDLDSDARIRVILSTADYGEVSTYGTVTSGVAYVGNSADGHAEATVNDSFDVSENDGNDFLDVYASHLARTVEGASRTAEGFFFVYISITDGDAFNADSVVWRTRGGLQLDTSVSSGPASPFQLLPEVFSIGTGGAVQKLEVRVDAGDEPVDLVLGTMKVDGTRFDIVDCDSLTEGIQPFKVGQGFFAPQLVTNTARAAQDGSVLMSFEYFEATSPEIQMLDGEHTLVTFEVVSLDGEGKSNTTIDLARDPETGRFSQLELDGRAIATPQDRPLALATLLSGRGTLHGNVRLQGRTFRSAIVDFSLRRWGSYEEIADSVFALANDVDLDDEGVQIALDTDGSFELTQVPTGRFDLHVHLDGYLDGWFPALDVQPSLLVAGVVPSTTGMAADSLMLGGDVSGYTELDGSSRPDNEVTLADWDFVTALFDQLVSADDDSARADISGDGIVNIRDLSLVGANFTEHGPRPVYKPTAAAIPPAYTTWSELVPGDDGGETVRLNLFAGPLSGIRAFEATMEANSEDWLVEGVDLGPRARAGLSVVRSRDWGQRLAVSLMGREADFSSIATDAPDEPFISWRLRRLNADPVPPGISEFVLIDQSLKEAESRVIGHSPPAKGATVPLEFTLGQNFPNPFNPETAIPFTVPTAVGAGSGRLPSVRDDGGVPQAVRVEVFNALGQRQNVLLSDALMPGSYRVEWDGRDHGGRPVGSGVYFYRVELHGADGNGQLVRRMLLVR